MEILQGQSNWKLIVRREQDHIVLLRAQTCDVRAVLPDELFGLPVTVLADHALAPNASAVAGEQVHITCGREGEWDNRNLQDLTLPSFCYSKIIVYHSFRHLHSQITKSPTEVGLFVMVPRFAAVSAGTHNRFTEARGIGIQPSD